MPFEGHLVNALMALRTKNDAVGDVGRTALGVLFDVVRLRLR